MPIAKSLGKITKVKGGSDLHPRGRKLKQLGRAQLRQNKLEEHKQRRNVIQDARLDRVRFFKEACTSIDQDEFSVTEIHEMIDAYINRNDDEIETIRQQRRPGRPTTPRYDTLIRIRDAELQEYKSGFLVPNLTSSEIVKRLKSWTGTVGGLNVVEFRRLSREASELQK